MRVDFGVWADFKEHGMYNFFILAHLGTTAITKMNCIFPYDKEYFYKTQSVV